jgi:hypothetical protein
MSEPAAPNHYPTFFYLREIRRREAFRRKWARLTEAERAEMVAAHLPTAEEIEFAKNFPFRHIIDAPLEEPPTSPS